MFIWELIKTILLGIVEGITEWLPVSSTGHMILLDEFIKLKVSPEFYEMFQVVIQLGAILAVLVLFFHKLNPFSGKKAEMEKKQTWQLWFKVVVAVIPSAVLGLLLDDWMDEHLYNYVVVAIALIVYGVAFMYVEKLLLESVSILSLLSRQKRSKSGRCVCFRIPFNFEVDFSVMICSCLL